MFTKWQAILRALGTSNINSSIVHIENAGIGVTLPCLLPTVTKDCDSAKVPFLSIPLHSLSDFQGTHVYVCPGDGLCWESIHFKRWILHSFNTILVFSAVPLRFTIFSWFFPLNSFPLGFNPGRAGWFLKSGFAFDVDVSSLFLLAATSPCMSNALETSEQGSSLEKFLVDCCAVRSWCRLSWIAACLCLHLRSFPLCFFLLIKQQA